MRILPEVMCSTGIFTHYPKFPDHRQLISYAGQIDTDFFELMLFPTWYPFISRVLQDFSKANLFFPMVHADKDIGTLLTHYGSQRYYEGLEMFTMNCEICSHLGSHAIVLHLWGLPDSDAFFENTLRSLEACLPIAHAHKLDLLVESIPCAVSTPLARLQQIIQHVPACNIVLDLRFLAYHDQVSAIYQCGWLWEDKVKHLHIHDYAGSPLDPSNLSKSYHPGEGDINFSEFFRFLKSVQYAGTLTLEASAIDSDGNVDVEKINTSLKFLREGILKNGSE